MRTIVGLLTLTVLSGCIAMAPKELDWRDSAQSQSSEHAVLRCWPSLQIVSIDGEKKDLAVGDGLWFQKCNIKIAAGPHTLSVRHYSSGGGPVAITTETGEMEVSFTAEAGGIYQLTGVPYKAGGSWVANAYRVGVRREQE